VAQWDITAMFEMLRATAHGVTLLALGLLLLVNRSGFGETDPKSHWAFQPVHKPAPPTVQNSAWVRTPVDAFVRRTLEEKNWSPAAPASKVSLIRRVYFDLTGLPPTPEAVQRFLQDDSPSSYERVVDQLLDSHEYAERSAQYWLDIVRYAETEGYEYDRHIPDAWRYRDYVIASFNSDKPYNRFVLEQIAGDEIDPESRECETASILHRLGPIRRNAGNPEIALSRNEVLTERTDIIGSAFLGLTVGCARCHNHKLEPILQKDYYQLQAYFAATEEHNIILASTEEQKSWDEKSKSYNDELKKLRQRVKTAQGDERMKLTEQIEKLEDQLPAPLATIPAISNDFAKATEIHVLKRGVWENKLEKVSARPPGILVPDDEPELPTDVRNPRTHLANWLVDPKNPLTARVIVNRLWQQHFGIGLVKTVNDFGTHGDRPSHPELLDWLAATLVENGWHLKPVHRLIVLSNTYQQASRSEHDAEFSREDPDNRFVWRFNRRRLSAEEIRDSMLALSGRLNSKAGGPSVMVPVEEDLVRLLYKPSQWQTSKNPRENDRRSIYLIAKRNLRLPFMDTFDAPALLTSCARRETSTHPPQALEMLNGKLSNDLAWTFAERLRADASSHPEQMVERAYWLAAGRAPTAREKDKALRFLASHEDDRSLRVETKEFALAMFNLNAFLYVD
jgi:hypothetical protein